MHGLQEQFGDRIDFIAFNIDRPETLPYRERFNMVQRSQYALIDAQGNVLQRWFGPLDGDAVAAYLEQFLASS